MCFDDVSLLVAFLRLKKLVRIPINQFPKQTHSKWFEKPLLFALWAFTPARMPYLLHAHSFDCHETNMRKDVDTHQTRCYAHWIKNLGQFVRYGASPNGDKYEKMMETSGSNQLVDFLVLNTSAECFLTHSIMNERRRETKWTQKHLTLNSMNCLHRIAFASDDKKKNHIAFYLVLLSLSLFWSLISFADCVGRFIHHST